MDKYPNPKPTAPMPEWVKELAATHALSESDNYEDRELVNAVDDSVYNCVKNLYYSGYLKNNEK